MEGNVSSNSCKGFWVNTFKILMSPILRFRKLLRKTNVRHIKTAIGVFLILSCILAAVACYWYRISLLDTHRHDKEVSSTTDHFIRGTPFYHINLNEAYKDVVTEVDDTFGLEEFHEAKMVDTPGCKIPVVLVNYIKYINRNLTRRVTCGKRAVFLRKFDKDTVQAFVKRSIIEKYMRHNGTFSDCCYRFILKDVPALNIHKRNIIYSNCTRFKNNDKIPLQTDFINVRCFENIDNKTYTIYDDMFAFTKKINVTKPKESKCKMKYNVLMIGMDSMSLPRAVQTLPRTIDFFRNDYWISYRGYHKIADATLPNLLSVLTGKNFSTIDEKCSGKMDKCNHLMIWNTFKEAGYVTAYGDDYLQLSETFSNEFQFEEPPTDHYMRPFFVKSEYRRKNSTFLCAGKACTGQQILDYALDFADTYKWESFFGFFWINSFSHDARSFPHQADKMLENFFNQLSYTRVLRNTFVIFFSDHGIRFGMQRLKMESYYDERMPMLFMWLPPYFKSFYSERLRAIAINQYRLITPYDIYSTLLEIKKLTICSNITDDPPEGCTNCHSTFEEITANRTCEDVLIHPKWCSCHKLYPLPVQDAEGRKSVELVVSYIQSVATKAKTKPCWSCISVNLKTVIRIHFYYDKDKISLYYVVAFTMSPGNMSYEATVLRRYDDSKGVIVGPVSRISVNTGLGSCAINTLERSFCVCQKNDKC